MPRRGSCHDGIMLVLLWLLIQTGSALAQKVPGLGYVYPPVVRAGETTSVQLGGFDFTVDLQWFVHDEHVRLQSPGQPGDYLIPPPPYWTGPRTSTAALPIPREVAAQIEVDAHTPEGLVRWQVANANGASETSVLYVSRGSEIIESRSRDFPQQLPPLPIGVSGRLSRLTEVDRYQFVADRDGMVSVDLMARRLGADFNGVVQVRDEAGQMLADFADTLGLDGGVTFAVGAGKAYAISLHDADFRGDRAYVYRLGISQAPRVICTVPAAGQRGTSTGMEFFGLGVATGQPVLESVRQEVSFSTDLSLTSQRLTVPTELGIAEVDVPLSDVPEQVRLVAASDSSEIPMQITAPGAVTGMISPDAPEHRFQWNAEKDERWSVLLHSRAIGSRMDVALEILDPEGIRVADNDDLPGTMDAGIEFQALVSGLHTVVVRNLLSTALPSFACGTAVNIYRVQLQRPPIDFSLSVPQRVALELGGKTELAVQAIRYGGFAGEIKVSIEGLPQGITVPGDGVMPTGSHEVKFTLESAADASVMARVIQVRGTATLGHSDVTRLAMAPAAGNLSPRNSAAQSTPHVLLAMTMPAPFTIQVVDRERQHDVHRGTTFLAELDIIRNEGFTGEIQLEMTAQQDRCRAGMRGGIVVVPPGQTKAFYPTFMPEWLGTELTRRIVIHGVAAIPDPKGNLRYVTKAGDARITMIMEGALLKVTAEASEFTVVPGAVFEIPVSVSRSAKLPVATTIELIVPEEIRGLLQAAPLILPPDQYQGKLTITTVADPALAGPWSFTLKATSLQDNQWPVVSQTDVPIVFGEPCPR